MRFKQKTLRSILSLIIGFCVLVTTGFMIYYFGLEIVKKDQPSVPVKPYSQPTFNQTETNFVVEKDQFNLVRFQQLLETKIPGVKFKYLVNNLNKPTKIQVSYLFEQKPLIWFYELQYKDEN